MLVPHNELLEQNPWEAESGSDNQEISCILWNLCTQEPTTDPFPESDESSPLPHTLLLYEYYRPICE
jgi:hypothetical protein